MNMEMLSFKAEKIEDLEKLTKDFLDGIKQDFSEVGNICVIDNQLRLNALGYEIFSSQRVVFAEDKKIYKEIFFYVQQQEGVHRITTLLLGSGGKIYMDIDKELVDYNDDEVCEKIFIYVSNALLESDLFKL